jgi:glycerol kinase
VRPVVSETTCLGAAYAAGLAVGVWDSPEALRAHWAEDARWTPKMAVDAREAAFGQWKKAVERTLGWVS